MISDEELETMKPKMSIEYGIDPDTLSYGNFDDIPKNAYMAKIQYTFFKVGANATFDIDSTSYNLYVGQVLKTTDLKRLNDKLNKNSQAVTNDEKILKDYLERGIENVTITKNGIIPLNNYDKVFSTYEEMVEAITKIKETFQSVDFIVQNAETNTLKNIN